MSEFRSLFRVELGPHHLRPGRTKHQLRDASGLHDFPSFKALEICSTGSQQDGFYLLYEPETGSRTDGWHQSLDSAFHQAEWEFGVTREEWKKTERSYRASKSSMPVPAIILAAGASRRLGRPKQLIAFEGETLLNRTLRLAREAGAYPVIAVLGAHVDQIQPTLPPQTQFIQNPEWQTGMASSIRAGIASLDADSPGVLILTCDQPRLTASHLRALLAAFSSEPPVIAASHYGGKRGTPAIFPRSLFPALVVLRGDKGARAILAQPPCALVEMDFPGGELDIDQPADLGQLGNPL